MSNRDELIAQFKEVSGCDENVAEFYLSSSNWSLEEALATFLGTQNDNDNNEMATGRASAPTLTTPSSAGAGASADLAPKLAGSSEAFVRSGAAKPKIATLNDVSKKAAADDDSEEEGQAFYAGGSDRSGQQVLGPPKRKNFREQLTDMFRMAQEHSSLDTQTMPSTSGAGNVWGQGVRLGQTESDHSVVPPKGRATGKAEGEDGEKKPIVVLKLWSQGFSIDDGELRTYDDPDNKEFLETVMRGEIPQELLNMGWMVNVDVEDHRNEDFKVSSTVKSFKGSGHALGSPTPNVTTAPQAQTSSSSAAATSKEASTGTVDTETVAKDQLKLDSTAPTTTLQIRLANGTRLTAQFNLTHTVADVQQYIQTARPEYARRNFMLVSTFPTRELKDLDATIDKAGLKNASIMQRLT